VFLHGTFLVNTLKDASVEDIVQLVEKNEKKRFALEDRDGKLFIKANQGHTIQVLLAFGRFFVTVMSNRWKILNWNLWCERVK